MRTSGWRTLAASRRKPGIRRINSVFIHVAGTNGKGSTCAILESIYRASRLRVGLFISPHLVSFRERIQVNRQLISETDVARLVQELRSQGRGHESTLFEFATIMALKYFAEQKCDLVIWETGLGGRLDATNIVTPLVSVITNIAFDHQQWLGDTLEKIAAEKAGIIKPGIPVITAASTPEALQVIRSTAQTNGSPFIHVEAGLALHDQFALSLLGEHQKINAALALNTIKVLQSQFSVSAENIRIGLSTVNWPGRLQVVERPNKQKVLLDGAHNLAGAEVLRAALEKEFAGSKPVLIFGALADKQWADICRVLAPVADKIFAVPVASERTASPEALAEAFQTANPSAKVSFGETLAETLELNKNEPFIAITGSLYLIGEALELLGVMPADPAGRQLNEWTKPGAFKEILRP